MPNTWRSLKADFGKFLRDRRGRGALAGLLALFVILCVAAILTGGQHVASNSVAEVNDTQITKADFNHWLAAAAHSQQTQGPAIVPDSPTFSACVAAKQKQPPPPGQPPPSVADLTNQCRQDYETFKNQALQFLISAQWVEQEADKRGIHKSDAQVRQAFDQQKAQAFPDENSYRQFIASSGQTEQDLLLHVKLSLLEQDLRQQVVSSAAVTDSDIANFYNHNRQQFSQPERRDIQVILTHDPQSAQQARQALDQGQDFKQVATKYSADKSAADTGGNLPDVTRGQQEKPLDDAIFAAKQGDTVGPIQTQFGWYVFRLSAIKGPGSQSLSAAHDQIKGQLQSQKQQQALVSFVQNFQDQYRSNTLCAQSFITSSCSNGPAPPPITQGG